MGGFNNGKVAAITIAILAVATFGLIKFLDFYDHTWGSKSLSAVSEADFVVNDGYSVEALDYSVIIDQRTGMEYLYFPGYGVTPYIDENGDVLKVVE